MCVEKGKMIDYGVQAEDMTYWMPLLTSAKGHADYLHLFLYRLQV